MTHLCVVHAADQHTFTHALVIASPSLLALGLALISPLLGRLTADRVCRYYTAQAETLGWKVKALPLSFRPEQIKQSVDWIADIPQIIPTILGAVVGIVIAVLELNHPLFEIIVFAVALGLAGIVTKRVIKSDGPLYTNFRIGPYTLVPIAGIVLNALASGLIVWGVLNRWM